MGKVKQRRQRKSRYNPTGTAAAALNGGELKASHAGLNIVEEKISSVVVEERVCGLNTLAAFAQDEDVPQVIASTPLVRKAASLLRDPSVEVRVAAAGALSNISAGGGDEVVEAMVQQDVLGPLSELLHEYGNAWSPALTALGQPAARDVDPMTTTLLHATYLLTNLCECNEEAVNVFNRGGLIHVLLRHLDPATWGPALALAVGECLLCVSESNASASSVLLPQADTLVSYVFRPADTPVGLRFAITITGVLMNINYCETGGENFQLVLKVFSAALQVDAVEVLLQHAECSDSNKPSMTLADLEHSIVAQQLALEVLSNICCSEEEEEWEEAADLSSEEDSQQCAMEETEAAKFVLSPEVHEGIRHFGLFQKALNKLQIPNETVIQKVQTVKLGPQLLIRLMTLQTRALNCLQNMAAVLDVQDMGGPDQLYATWVRLGTMVFQNNCTDTALLEAATGSMRAFIDHLSQDKCEKLASITAEDLQVMFEAGVGCSVASVRGNLARMVGILGCLLVAHNTEEALASGTTFQVLNAASEYLLKVAANDNELWVSAEALDVIIDLYSDDKTDKLAHHVHLVDRLKGIQPQFKLKHHQQKKKLGEHRALILTVRDNILGFIKYKAGRTAKYRKS